MRWDYIHIDTRDVMMMSGWKLYLYGDNMKDLQKIRAPLLSVCTKYNLTTKLATESIIRRDYNRNIAWSIAIIYLVPSIIGNINLLLSDLNKLSLRSVVI